jgi:hypothetical protein
MFQCFFLFSGDGGNVFILHCSEESEYFVRVIWYGAVKKVGGILRGKKFASRHSAATRCSSAVVTGRSYR